LGLRVVHISFELDHNPFLETAEVHNESMQYMLPPKLQPQDSAIAQ